MRGPSGRGASRAEEKGASRLARAGVLDRSPSSPLGSRDTAFPVHWPSGISSGANQAPSHGFHESRDTKHETRLFIETRPFRFTGRQTFLLERTRPPPMVFTNHETRDTAFYRNTAFPVHWPSGISSGVNKAPSHGFHETRDTKHESRLFIETRDTKHESRPLCFSRITRFETGPLGTEALQSFFSGPGCVA